MASSTLSLDSLSSPSPSPSPPPPTDRKSNAANKSNAPTATAPPLRSLDTDSELSELTEDDQDATTSAGKRAASTGGASSSKMPAESAHDDDDDQTPASSGPPSKTARRGTHQRSLSARGGRKKRSSIVPAPMWGWAESKAPPAEEEEEEMSGPPRPMEEEEEEEEEEEDYEEGDESGGEFVNQRRMGPYVTQRLPGIRNFYRKSRGGGRGGHRQARREDDDGSASGSDYASSKKKKPTKTRVTRKRADDSSGSEPPKVKKNSLKDDGAPSSDENTESEDEAPRPPPPDVSKPLSAITPSSALNALAVIADSVDPTEPAAREVVSINAAAASASIMAGNVVMEQPSASTSADATPVASRSRSTSEEPVVTKPPARRGAPKKVNGKVVPPPSPKKAPPPPLDLKIDTDVGDLPDKPIIESGPDDGMEVDEVVNDRSLDIDMDEEDEDEGEEEASQHDEEEPINPDEDALDADEDAVEGEDEVAEGEEDQEAEHDAVEAENEQENCDGENDEEPSPDVDLEDQEIELQPAHRAEALDVLATIELKFALLRERVYVEKMEGLAWEEAMVQAAVHPEMLHLQKELSKRRDKRLELASRKRSYEVANATKRRKADEDSVWSWWKLSVDDVQTDLISETNRKRRKLERERRAIERPQQIRRIPHPPAVDPSLPLPPPSLRKILKSYPFETSRHNKSDSHRQPHSLNHPKNFVYPEISTLSAAEVASDLEFLNSQRRGAPHDTQPAPPPLWGRTMSFTPQNGSGLGPGPGPNGMPGMNRTTTNGNSNVPPPSSQSQPMVGPPQSGSIMHPHPNQHPMGFDQYGDGYGPGGPPPGRIRDQPPPGPYPHSQSGPPTLGPGGPRENVNAYPNFSGPGGRQSAPHGVMPGPGGQGYPLEHDMNGSGGPGSGTGHQLMPHHPYFSQGSIGPGSSGNPYPPLSSHHHGSGMKVATINGRRSPSPHVLPNGSSSASGKANGNWMGIGMGMGTFHLGNGKGGDRDVRMTHEDEEKERMMVERERESRKRAERDSKMDRREQERDLERRHKEHQEMERERREQQHLQQHQQHRQGSSSGLPHVHSGGVGGLAPTQGSGVESHHHHHRTHHHHHVLHRHGPQHASSSLPPPGPSGPGGVPPIVHSPRSARDYEPSRPPPPLHTGPGQPHPTEVILLKSSQARDRDSGGHWPAKNEDPHHNSSSIADYRDNRERDMRKPYSQRPPSRPPMIPLDAGDDRADRPMATPFVMASSHTMQQVTASTPSGPYVNGSGAGSAATSPRDQRGAPSWNTPGGEEPPYRMSSTAPPGYHGSSHDPHVRSPVQAHRYGPGGPPSSRMSTGGSSSSIHRISSPPPPSGRARPPQSPSYPHSNSHRSPATSPKMRPLSPGPNNKHLLSGGPPGSGYSSSPRLAGPGRTSTPTGHHTPLSSHTPTGPLPPMQADAISLKNGAQGYAMSRTASPLMSSLHPPSRSNGSLAGAGGNTLDRDRDRSERERHVVVLSPRLGPSAVSLPPPSKLSAA